jgi:signal transduction histidine kinase
MSRSVLYRYGIAAAAVALALALTLLVAPAEQGSTPLFLAAVMVSAWWGGLGPGLWATALSLLILDLELPPLSAPGPGFVGGVRLVLFVLAAVLISSLSAAWRRLEQALRLQDRRKDEFLAVLAHELRNPLSALLNALHALRLGESRGADAAQVRDIVERQAQQMVRLIDDLLDISRIAQGKLRLSKQPVDLAKVVARAVETTGPLLRGHGHRLELAVPAGPVPLEADPTRLEQIIVNLLSNAAKYTEPQGLIRLAVERLDGEVALKVRDTGIGLSPEVLPRVFDLFAQVENGSRGGLGIGLNLVQRLVKLQGGTVTASSAGLGRGSEFVVRFPASPASP